MGWAGGLTRSCGVQRFPLLAVLAFSSSVLAFSVVFWTGPCHAGAYIPVRTHVSSPNGTWWYRDPPPKSKTVVHSRSLCLRLELFLQMLREQLQLLPTSACSSLTLAFTLLVVVAAVISVVNVCTQTCTLRALRSLFASFSLSAAVGRCHTFVSFLAFYTMG